MDPLISLLAVVPLVVFYLWMFWDMTKNDTLTGSEKYNWLFVFIIFNVFAAAYYYVNVYRKRY